MPLPSASAGLANASSAFGRSWAFTQFGGHRGDGALVDLGPIPILEHSIVGRARLPTLSSLPAMTFEKVGGRGQHVSHAAFEVPASVTVEVHGVLVVAGRQKLGVPDLPGPTTAHLGHRKVTALENA